ncbi:MAG: family 43 glycosylhydrolase, partial [Bifidobacteriaceae bacterium]|nr:family 43 glycosylhydrolase [Bifidobacteriaceae bacterium]
MSELQHRKTNRRLVSLTAAAALVGALVTVTPAAWAAPPDPVPGVPPTATFHSNGNPILSDGTYYSADAAPLVDNGVLYIYTGHDTSGVNTGSFTMNDYGVFATNDVASGDWSHWQPNFQPATVYPDWATGQMAYAGHVTKGADGKFYWYTPVQWTNTAPANRMAIGVAVSNTPVGPWQDARALADGTGTPLVSWVDVFGTSTSGQEVIDPCVFVDTDGRVYLFWGSWSVVRVVELDPDMVHIKAGATIQTVNMSGNGNSRFYEAPWVFKKNNLYYMVYDWKNGGIGQCTPSNYQACIAYATATSPTGPYSYQGIIMTPGSSTTMHPSVIEFNGQWYITYHTKDATNGSHFRRSVAIDKLYWDGDAILPVTQTWDPAIDPFMKLRDNVAFDATVSASYDEGPPARITAVNDGIRPTTAVLPPDYWSSYRGTANSTVSSEWLMYQWATPVRIDGMGIQFRTDSNYAYAPSSWSVEYLGTDGVWYPVTLAGGSSYGTTTSFQTIDFAATYVATALRANFNLSAHSGGSTYNCVFVPEWEVYGVQPDSADAPTVYTTPGVAPKLPGAVRIHYGADAVWSPTNWRAIDPSQYAAAGTFTVDGRVSAKADAYVQATVVVSTSPAPPVTDTTPPTATITLSGTQGQEGWYSTNVVARVAADDETSYENTVATKTGTGAYTETEGVRYVDVTVSTNGTTTVYGKAKDAAGNWSAEVSATVKIDKAAPSLTGSFSDTTREVTVTASDALSGLDTVQYRWDGAGSWTAYTVPVAAPDVQAHQLDLRATDKAGNTATAQVTVPRDPSAPLTRENVAPYATPTGSGVTSWNAYTGLNNEVIAGGTQTDFWGTWGLTASGGYHYVMYTWSTAQWVDELNVVWFRDSADTANAGMIPPTAWVAQYCSVATCSVTSDAGWVDIEPTGTTSYTREATANTSTSYTHPNNTVTFDPISVTQLRLKMQNYGGATGGSGDAGIREWQVFSSTVQPGVSAIAINPTTASVARGGSTLFTHTITAAGVSDAVTWSVTGGTSAGTEVSASGGLTVGSDETANSLTVTVTAVADSTKTASATVTVTGDAGADITPPEVTFTVTAGSAGVEGWYRNNVTLRVNGTDNVSALLTIDYKIDAGEWVSTAAVANVTLPQFTTAGEYVVTAKAKDQAGNWSDEGTFTVKIDKTAPTVDATFDAWARLITITAADAASGLQVVEYRWDGTGTWLAYSDGDTVTPPDAEAHTFNYRATDKAGTTTTKSLAITRDPDIPAAGNLAPLATATSTNNSAWTTPGAMNDECLTQDNTCAWHTWPDVGQQTATLTWDTAMTINEARVYWFADSLDTANEGVIPPSAWSLEYWDGTAFQPVVLDAGDSYGRDRTTFNTVHFTAVTTTILRMQITSWGAAEQGGSPGIREWQVYGPAPAAEVQTVKVRPDTDVALRVGQTQQFEGVVKVTGTLVTTGTWSVSGAADVGTTIDATGLLSVPLTETATTVTVTYTSDEDPTKTATVTVTLLPSDAAIVPGTVAITGQPVTAATLTADPGTWDPATVNLAYQWQADGVDIAGATATTYTVTAADVGKQIGVVVTGTQSGYPDASASAQVGPVQPGTLTPGTPAISGTVKVGEAVTANPGTWAPSPVTLGYQWKLDGVDISGATSAGYTLQPADAGKALSVVVTGSKGGFTSASVTAGPVTVQALTMTPGTPTISGLAMVGHSLTVAGGTWTPSDVQLAYQWKVAGAAVSGAVTSTYVVQPADANKAIIVVVTGVKTGYDSASATAGPVTAQPLALTTATPTISGTVKVGQTVTAVPGAWGPQPVSYVYQWTVGTAVVGSGASYTIQTADAGKTLKVEVAGSKVGYSTAAMVSAGVAIPAVPATPTPSKTTTPTPAPSPAGTKTATPTPAGPKGYVTKYESFVLSPDLSGDGRGEILAISKTGALDMHSTSATGTITSSKTLVASGESGKRVYGPGDWNSDKANDIVSVDKSGNMFL